MWMVVSASTEYFEVLNALTLCTTKLVKRRTMKLAITQSSLELLILCIYFYLVLSCVMLACCNCIRVRSPPRILSAGRYRKPENRIPVHIIIVVCNWNKRGRNLLILTGYRMASNLEFGLNSGGWVGLFLSSI